MTHVKNFWSPELRKKEIPLHDERVFTPVPGYMTQTLLARKELFDRFGGFNSG